MAPQTSYGSAIPVAFAGMKGDLTPDYVRSYANGEASAEIPFGVAVAAGSADDTAILPASAGARLLGIVLHAHNYALTSELGTTGLKPKVTMNVLVRGTAWVTVEEAVNDGDRCFIRHTAKGGNTQLGKFRKSADGVAEVKTITPTAADTTQYGLRVSVGDADFEFSIVSDGSATATEIVSAFKTVMAADDAFSALVAASGTSTLILTGAVAGTGISVESNGAGTLAVADTTPGAATAVELRGARFLTTAGSGGLALVEADFNTVRANQ